MKLFRLIILLGCCFFHLNASCVTYINTQIDIRGANTLLLPNDTTLQSSQNTTIPQDIMIHTFDNSVVERNDFHQYTNWYEEDGNIQTFKLHPGDCNTRNERKYCRIEAHTKLKMKKGEQHEFTATYNIMKCEEVVCIFQVFNSSVVHPQLYIKMLPNGDLRYQSRGNDPGLIDSNCLNKEFTLHIKDDGINWHLFYNGDKIAEGPHQEKGLETVCEFRWGLYNNNIPSTEIYSTVKDVIIK
jgi:hypothetical protein